MIISMIFFGLLSGSALFNRLLPWQKIMNLFLSLVSLAYIAWFDHWAGIMVIILTLLTCLFAQLIDKKKNKVIFHKLGIIGLIGVLIFFKYTGLLVNTINQLHSFNDALP